METERRERSRVNFSGENFECLEEKRVLLTLQSQIFNMGATTTTASVLRDARLVAYLIHQSRRMELPALELGLYALLDCVVECSTREQLRDLVYLLLFGQLADASGDHPVRGPLSSGLRGVWFDCLHPTDLTNAARQLTIHLCERPSRGSCGQEGLRYSVADRGCSVSDQYIVQQMYFFGA